LRRRFFVDRFDGRKAHLRGESGHHLGRVLRAVPGQLYELSDGIKVWLARVERVSREGIAFALVQPVAASEPRLRVTLLLSIVKFDRFEWCLEKATELGVAEVVPLAAARSDKALIAAAAKRAERWRKILLGSAQQSRRLRPPELRPAVRPAEIFRAGPTLRLGSPLGFARGDPEPVEGSGQAGRAAAVLLSERPEAASLRQVLGGKQTDFAVLAIGPEGGWTDEERAMAERAGFLEASLGPTILRTETAVIAGLAALNYALGDSGSLV